MPPHNPNPRPRAGEHHTNQLENTVKIEVDDYDMHRMIMLLDAADDALTAAANAEHHRESGKSIRQITAQDRAKATRLLVAEMMEKYQ